MESQYKPSVIKVLDSQVNGSQHDSAMITPQIDANISNTLPAANNGTTGKESTAGKNNPPVHDVGDNVKQAPSMTASQPNATTNNPTNLPVAGGPAMVQEVKMKDTAPLRKSSGDLLSLAPCSALIPVRPKHPKSTHDKKGVDGLTTPQKKPTGGHLTTPRNEPKSQRALTTYPATIKSQLASPSGNRAATSSTIGASTFCNPHISEGTASAPKRPWSPSLVDDLTDKLDATVPSDTQRDFVFRRTIRELSESWQNVLELYGMRLGSREAFTIDFVPDVSAIRQRVMRRWAPLDEIADAVEAALLAEWSHRCRRVIRQYYLDMQRDLVAEAHRSTRGVKDRVIAEAMSIRTPRVPKRLRIPSAPGSRPSLFDASPRTPDSKKRRAVDDVDALRLQVAGMHLERKGRGKETEGSAPQTPTSAKRRKATTPMPMPKGLTTPVRRRYGWQGARCETPTRPSRRAATPSLVVMGENGDVEVGVDQHGTGQGGVMGHIGRYPVTQPPVPAYRLGSAGGLNSADDEDDGADADVSSGGEDDGNANDDDVFTARK